MTQENKELRLKDLCARLPYGVKVKFGDNPNIFDLEYRIKFAAMYGDSDKLEDILDITNIKPYLRPMSSMTGVETLEYLSLKESIVAIDDITYFFETYESIDYLDKNMFDYRGLIPKGLAIDATGKGIY